MPTATARTACERRTPEARAVIRWMLLMFVLLVLVNSATGFVRRIGLGRLPGDVTLRIWGREVFMPFASSVMLTVAVMGLVKLLAWLF